MLDDRELWKRISVGDVDAFDTWYRETAPRLLGFLRHLTGSEHAADDLMQETYTSIWRRPQGFDPTRGTARAYLFGVARNQAAEWWRNRHPVEPLSDEAPALAQTETRSILVDALRHLSPDQQSLLWLREVEGQSYAELAAILNVPVGTVRSRLFAAREALRAVWRETPAMKGGRP